MEQGEIGGGRVGGTRPGKSDWQPLSFFKISKDCVEEKKNKTRSPELVSPGGGMESIAHYFKPTVQGRSWENSRRYQNEIT